jgi:predicted RNA-binding Zn ribbon-like protein
MPLLCLDFANTVGRTKRGNAGEELDSYAGLLRWCRTARLIDADTEDRLRGEAIADMAVARRELGRGWMLRQVLVAVFEGIASGDGPPALALTRLNQALAESPFSFALASERAGLAVRHVTRRDDLLAPVLLSAAMLLGSPDAKRLRRCEAADCGRFYLDTTRNRSRRWCDMATCGNRAKARRHRERGISRGPR